MPLKEKIKISTMYMNNIYQPFGDVRVRVGAKLAAIQIASLVCSVGNSSVTEVFTFSAASDAMYGCLICAIASSCSGDGRGGERGFPQL